MSYQHSSVNKQYSNTMSEENFNQIIDAILDGKYSWACVLILQAAGYNPLHYIPYRTYNRLIKQNKCTASKSSTYQKLEQKQKFNLNGEKSSELTSKIRDLNHLGVTHKNRIRGGRRSSSNTTGNFLLESIYMQ